MTNLTLEARAVARFLTASHGTAIDGGFDLEEIYVDEDGDDEERSWVWYADSCWEGWILISDLNAFTLDDLRADWGETTVEERRPYSITGPDADADFCWWAWERVLNNCESMDADTTWLETFGVARASQHPTAK